MKIQNLSELMLCLPLVRWCFLGDFLCRVAGISDPNYLTEKLEDLWHMIPASPSKEFVRHYHYYHIQKPTITEIEADDVKTEVSEKKLREYRAYITNRQYCEEQAAYLASLQGFRERLMCHTENDFDV